MAIGRPSKYKPEYCKLLIEHMKTGLSFEAFGAKVDSGKATLYMWLKKNKEFRDAKKKGDAYSQEFWEQKGLDGLKDRTFNSAVWIFNMKNRFLWRDRKEIDGDWKFTEKKQKDFEQMSDKEVAEAYKQELDKRKKET